jgi:O-antigen/teichoic acid export membrane protein
VPRNRSLDIGTRQIGVNTLWNLAGVGLPTLFTLVAIPFIVYGLGTDRFGLLLLVWALIGYFGLVDLGIGRALAQTTAAQLGAGQARDIPSLVWSGLTLMSGLGVLGGFLLAGAAGPLVRLLLEVPEPYQDEAIISVRIMALGLPIIVVAGGLTAVLSSYQKFPLINGLQIPFSALNNLCQALTAMLWPNLTTVVTILIVVRTLNALAMFWLCWRLVPFPSGAFWKRKHLGILLRFGSWITVTNIVGPLMVYLDRFVIGVMISMSAVAYYATPHEVVIRLLVLPGAIVGVLFPTFATMLQQDHQRVARLVKGGLATNFMLSFPLTVILVGFAEPLLSIWLGPQFASRSAPVLKILAIGLLINSLAQVPYVLVQGARRPDLTAKLHLIELLPYLLLLVWLTHLWGIIGAAILSTLRLTIAGLIVSIMARWLLPELNKQLIGIVPVGLLCGAILIPLGLDISPVAKLFLAVVAIIGAALLLWFGLFTAEDRKQLLLALRAQRQTRC